MKNVQIAFTMDFDWASEAVIEYSLRQVVESKIPITLFATHNSIWINQQAVDNDNIELEIHPNFCRNSTHGNTQEEVFAFCNTIKSEKKGFRCHRFFNNNDIQEYYKKQGFIYSSNICTDLEYVKPFINRVGLKEIPIYMEDGGFLFQKHSLNLKTFLSKIPLHEDSNSTITIVLLFHPMHLAFNSNSYLEMKNFKQSLSIRQYQNITFDEIRRKRGSVMGIGDLFEEIYNWSEAQGIDKVLLKDVANG